MNEQEMMQLIRARDEKGLEELMKHYGPLMRYIIAPILPDAQDQEECLSEISMRIWEKVDLYDKEKGKLNVWITALTRNAAVNKARKRKPTISLEEVTTEAVSSEKTPEEIVLEKERQQELKKALNHLSVKERNLFYRKYYYLQPTAQIAAELGMTERAVEGKLYRLKQRLRKELGGAGYV